MEKLIYVDDSGEYPVKRVNTVIDSHQGVIKVADPNKDEGGFQTIAVTILGPEGSPHNISVQLPQKGIFFKGRHE